MKKIKLFGRISFIALLTLIFQQSVVADGKSKIEVVFEGNEVFSQQELLDKIKDCEVFKDDYEIREDFLEYGIRECVCEDVEKFLRRQGYMRAITGEVTVEKIEDTFRVIVPFKEGLRYRLGEIRMENVTSFPSAIFDSPPFKSGDFANLEAIGKWMFEKVQSACEERKSQKCEVEIEPIYKPGERKNEGMVDFVALINEGFRYRFGKIYFSGNTFTRDRRLRIPLGVHEADIYSDERLRIGLERLNELGILEPITFEENVELEFDAANLIVDIIINMKEKRQK